MKLSLSGVAFVHNLVWNVRYVYKVHVGCDTQSNLFLSGAVSPNISTAATWGRFSRVFTWSHLSLFCAAPNVVTINVRSSRLPPPLAGWSRCRTARGVYGGFICEKTQRPLHIREEVRKGAEPSPHQDGLIDWSREPANVIPGKRGFATGFLTILLACLRYQWWRMVYMYLLSLR